MHRNELPKTSSWSGLHSTREAKIIEDFKQVSNPELPMRYEPIDVANGDQRPWPCVWPGCMLPCLETSTLCSEHEMAYIARSGKRSPEVKSVVEWNDQLHARAKWLLPHWNKETT